jgi:hypothetical protein
MNLEKLPRYVALLRINYLLKHKGQHKKIN